MDDLKGKLTEEIEAPFGTEPNDLALNAISLTIENTLLDMMGQSCVEEPEVKGKVID